MDSVQLKKMNEKVQALHDAMAAIMPLESIREHPFDFFQTMTDRLLASVDTVFGEIEDERMAIQRETDDAVGSLRKMRADLGLSELVMPDLHNVHMAREYVRNETDRVLVERKTVEARIAMMAEDIRCIEDVLGIENVRMQSIEVENDGVSLARLERLRMQRDTLEAEKMRREEERERLFREIRMHMAQLGRHEDVEIGHKIFVLEEMHRGLRSEVENRSREFGVLEREIRRKERCLETELREIEEGFGDENMRQLREYNVFLEGEQRRLLDEIYERHSATLRDLLDLFGVGMKEYARTEEDLDEMRRMIDELEPKRELFVAITSLISRRSELIERMNEFEKIASDPKRLFKSSFQLLSEEKFRNSAFPNLMKTEEAIFALLDEYRVKFGEFRRGDGSYEEALRQEIESRIINKTVFISRFESPARKRRG